MERMETGAKCVPEPRRRPVVGARVPTLMPLRKRRCRRAFLVGEPAEAGKKLLRRRKVVAVDAAVAGEVGGIVRTIGGTAEGLKSTV